MDFSWEELDDEARQKAYADWEAGKGLIGGDPRRIPNADRLPIWGLDQRFFRTLALNDKRSRWNEPLQRELASTRPLEIEIGFGRGDFLLDRAARYPERLFIGYEVKTKAVRLALARVQKRQLSNIWLSDDDVRFSLPRLIRPHRTRNIHILFPDPWWKDQHRIKRLFSPPFVDLLATVMQPGGLLYFKSDVEQYGELVRYLVENHADFGAHDPTLVERIGTYAPTHREFWCTRNDKPVYAYYFERK